MGSRADKVPLDQVSFDFVPSSFKKEAYSRMTEKDDPELPYLQRLYADCYQTIFERAAQDNISRYKDEIAANARRAKCSVRMFILANMVAHTEHERAIIGSTDKLKVGLFCAKLLIGVLALKRARTYQKMCSIRYGTFSLSSLATLADDGDKQDIETILLNSEVAAAQWLVRHKIKVSGPAEPLLYESVELQLAPEWLALEETYFSLILQPYIERKLKGAEAEERHRYNVFRLHGHYNRHPSDLRLALIARQCIMPEAVRQVVDSFGLRPSDFLYPPTHRAEPLAFWKHLALALRHYHCWLYLNGEPSFFTPRRNPTLVRRIEPTGTAAPERVLLRTDLATKNVLRDGGAAG